MISEPIESSKRKEKQKFRLLRLNKWLIILIVLLLLGGVSWVIYRQIVVLPKQEAKRSQQTITAAKENLTVTVSANGTVQPEMAINISPKTSGILKKLFVKEGDLVKQGQLLAKMDDSNLQGQLLQYRGQLAQSEANLEKLIAGNRPQDIAQAQAELAQAEANLEKLIAGNRPQEIAQAQARLESALSSQRQTEIIFGQNQQLYRDGAISQREWETSHSEWDSAQAKVREARQALALQKIGSRQEDIRQAQASVAQKRAALSLLQAGSRTEDIAQARAQVMAARGTLKTIQTQINDTEIRAPFSGVVARKYADPGAFVTPTTAGSSVSSATSSSIIALAAHNQVITNVAETNIAQMRLGQKATIKADAYPGKVFEGKVIQIAPQSIVQQNVTSFEVKVEILSDPQNLLRSGMNVNVDFAAGKLTNALVVPTVAIVRQRQGTGVYVWRKDNQSEFVPIKTGMTVNDKTEVLSGLQEGDRIFITFPEGQRPISRVPGSPGIPGLGR